MTDDKDMVVDAEVEGDMAIVKPSGTLMVSAGGAMLPPVEEMAPVLAEYDKRKKFFLQWLKEHFIEGVHYGTPPGCEPRQADSRQWRSKPSLYDAGAKLCIDLFGCRLTYETAPELIEATSARAKQAGAFGRRCLVHSSSGEVLGEGTGMFIVGEKKMRENSAIKMCDKRARVAAVLDAFPFLRELFTQDLEDLASPADKLRSWVHDLRDGRDGLDDEAWLATVCGQVLYGKSILTTRKECDAVFRAIEDGQFDLDTGERIASPKKIEQPDDEAVNEQELTAFRKRVSAKRGDASSLDHEAFIAAVIEAEFGQDGLTLDAMDRSQYRQILDALGAGKYDWDTAERLPE